MRTKDEILDSCRNDIMSEGYKDQAAFWLEYRKIEVLVDIRDELSTTINVLISLRESMDKSH